MEYEVYQSLDHDSLLNKLNNSNEKYSELKQVKGLENLSPYNSGGAMQKKQSGRMNSMKRFNMDSRKVSQIVKADTGGDNELFAIFDNLGTTDARNQNMDQTAEISKDTFKDVSFKIKPRETIAAQSVDQEGRGRNGSYDKERSIVGALKYSSHKKKPQKSGLGYDTNSTQRTFSKKDY